MKCYKCKREVPDEAKFCPKCGSPQEFTKELIDRAVNSDQPAITQLYNMTKDNVYYTIKTMISDEDTAQDLTQDTFLKAMKNLGQLKEPAAFRGWIKKIARNMTIDVLRKRKVISFSQMVPADSDEAIEFEDDRQENLPEVVIDRKETTRLIGEILGTLSPEQRVVTELFYYENLSVKEIAEELGVSGNTVKSRLKYARNKIEIGVKELEKKGTKLYGLSPIPFLLLLLRSQDAYAAELPNADMLLQSMQSGNVSTGAEDGFSGQSADSGMNGRIAKTAAGAASKGVITKIIAGIVAAALIGGTIAGIMAHNKEDEPQEPVQTEEAGSVTAKDFEGYYTNQDTGTKLRIISLDDTRAEIRWDNFELQPDYPFANGASAVIDGDLMITSSGEYTFTLSGDQIIVTFLEPDIYASSISGTYVPEKKEELEKKADIKDYIGTFMNGNDIAAGKITISENDPQSVNVRLEAFKTFDAGEVSTIFENVGYPFENGIYIDVSGERVEFIKETQDSYILDVPEALKQDWNIILNYENKYVLFEEGLEETAEIGRFVGTYAQDYGEYDYFLDLSIRDNGLLGCTAGNDRHGGFFSCEYTDYSITGNELRAARTNIGVNGEESVTDTFVLNDDGSITAAFSEGMFGDGAYAASDASSMYDSTENYP